LRSFAANLEVLKAHLNEGFDGALAFMEGRCVAPLKGRLGVREAAFWQALQVKRDEAARDRYMLFEGV
jgi:hypothetical protein